MTKRLQTRPLGLGCLREAPSFAREEEQGSRPSLPACWEARVLEPQLDECSKAPGAENKQWRRILKGSDDWVGSGEARPPQWRSRASAL